MPDVFDQLAAPAAPPQGDVFDHVAAQPKGDVFDQVAAAPAVPQIDPSNPMARALAQANAVNAGGITPIEQASAQYQLQHPSAAPQGVVQNAAAAFAQPFDTMANAAIRTGNRAGLLSDMRAQAAMGQHPFGTPEQGRLGTAIGGGLGNAAAIMGSGPFAPGTAAIMGGEGEREKLDARLAAGEQISGLQQAGDVGGQAGLAAALTYLAPGGGATKAITGAAGKVANPLLNFGRNVAVGAGAGITEQVGQQLGSNALSKYVGGEKNKDLTEGVEEAAKTGAVFGGVGQAVHEAPGFLNSMREKAASPSAPSEATKPPVMPEAVPAPKTPETAQPAPAEVQTHPDRFDDVQKLTDWYNTHHPEEKTGDIIKAMTPDMPHVKASVPVEFAQGVGEDVDRGKVDALKGLSQAERDKLPPAILGPNGDIIDGGHRIAAAQEAGATHVQAYVPEDLIGQHGIEASGGKVAEAQPATESAQPRLYGGNRAGAVALPSRADVTGPGSIYHEEVKPQLEKFNKASKEIFTGLKQMFPVETGAGSEEAQNAFREHFNRNANAHFAAEDAFASARKGFEAMHPADQKQFMRAMYNKDAQPTPALQKIADDMYADTNEGREALASLGHEAAAEWDKQKWNMLWKKDSKAAAELLNTSGNPNRPGRIEGQAGFLKRQKLGDFDEGLVQGLVPKYDNPVDMFLATKAERGKYIAGVRGMEQLVRNDQIIRGPKDEPIPEGWSEVPGSAKGPLNNVLATGVHADKLKGEGPLIAPDGVNRILKNITTPSALGNKAAFRLLMDANNTMTQSLLGLSGFHVKKVSQELINLSAARAMDLVHNGEPGAAGQVIAKSMISPFAAVRNGANIQKMMLGQMDPQTGQQAQVIDAMKSQFKARPDKEYETQWGRKFQKAISDGGLQGMLRAGAHALPAANEHLMQNGVFAFVQHAKLHMGSEMVTDYLNKNPNASREQLVKETGKISDHLDNVLGLMNRDNLFWNRTARDLATLSTLSVGWNYGSARALGGGIVDLGKGLGSLKAGGKLADIDTRRISYLATTAALTALTGAATTYLATGRAPQKLRDYVFPPSGGKDREGHDIRLNTGFYTSDYFDFFHHPLNTLSAKASPLVHVASDLLTNRDYKGDKITDWSDEKWYQNAADVAKYLAKSATPMSVQQLHDVISGGGEGKSLGMKLAGFAGVKTAPRNLSMSDAENEAHQIMQGKESAAGRSVREADLSGVKGRLADEVRDKNPDAQKDIQQAVQKRQITGKDTKGIFKRATEPLGLPGLLKSSELDARDLMDKVWPKMTPQERTDNQWMVRGKIGRANLSPEERQTYWNQIKKDMLAK